MFPEQEYLPGVKSTDFVIFENDNAIFIEIVAKRFNYVANLQKLDKKMILRDIQAMVLDKVKQ